jgi:hypothetical protein
MNMPIKKRRRKEHRGLQTGRDKEKNKHEEMKCDLYLKHCNGKEQSWPCLSYIVEKVSVAR